MSKFDLCSEVLLFTNMLTPWYAFEKVASLTLQTKVPVPHKPVSAQNTVSLFINYHLHNLTRRYMYITDYETVTERAASSVRYFVDQ